MHGIDVTQALGRAPVAGWTPSPSPPQSWTTYSPDAPSGTRPPDLVDDLAWVHAASGRADHADNRLPLIG